MSSRKPPPQPTYPLYGDVTWEEPPPPGKGSPKISTDALEAILSAHPGRWGWIECTTSNAANAARHRFDRRGIDAAVRGSRLYARIPGPGQPLPPTSDDQVLADRLGLAIERARQEPSPQSAHEETNR